MLVPPKIIAKGENNFPMLSPLDHFNKAEDYYQENKLKLAIKHYNQAISLDPNFTAAYINLGISYVDSKDLLKASQVFSIATKLSPDRRV